MTDKAALLTNIAKSGLCSGCGLCASAAPSAQAEMTYVASGFLRPMQNAPLSDADAAMVSECCPGLRVTKPAAPAGGIAHPVWGGVGFCGVGWSANADERRYGSSGGALTAVLRYLLESGKATFIAHVSAAKETPTRNQLLISRSAPDVLSGAGSRYGPTAPLANIRALLALGEPFAFVGKPCDVAALRAYARHDARVDTLVIAMVSFFCGGVPSERGTQNILVRMGLADAPLKSFRYRGDGWPGRARAETIDGAVQELSYQETWGAILSRHVQFRCKICVDSVGEAADLVFADAWFGSDDGYPLFEERDGRSLIVTRNERGQALLGDVTTAGALYVEPIDLSEVDRMQPYQARRKSAIGWRILALRMLGRSAPRYPGFTLPRLMVRGNIARNLKNFAGTVRRLVWRGEARESLEVVSDRKDVWRSAEG